MTRMWEGPQLPSAQADRNYRGLEEALLDSLKREAQAAAAPHARTASAVAFLRARGGRSVAVPFVGEFGFFEDTSPLRQWWEGIVKTEENFGRWEFAAVLIFDKRYQPPQPYFQAYALSPTIVGPVRDLETKVGAQIKEDSMNGMNTNGGSYPEVAARAVRDVSQQNPALAYGYSRSPVDGGPHQKIYLFSTLDEARGWFTALAHAPAQSYDYIAVFMSPDLSRPVPGLESFGHTVVSGVPQIGNVLPFLLGLPLGALGGYFYRGWQDQHPGQWVPGLSGGPNVGGPWLDMVGPQVGGPWVDMMGPQVGGPWVDMDDMPGSQPNVGGPWVDMMGPQVGGPWLDMVGPQVGGPWVDLLGAEVDGREQRLAWQQTRALIESAKRDVLEAQARTPAAAWVWSFDSSPSSGRVTELFSSQVIPFSSVERAQDYMYERLHMPHIALALFDTFATRHWPNPVRWTKSDDPSYEPLIAQRVAEYASTRTAGDYAGRRATTIGSALDDVRTRAQTMAGKRAGAVVGVFHATKDQLWHALAFSNEDDADDWLETLTPESFTYAAYFDRNDATWPGAVLEKIGGFQPAPKTKLTVGAGLEDFQAYAKALATGTQGNAVGVVRLVDGTWSTRSFNRLDDAIDWLSGWTARKTSFLYAAAFEKGSDGTAYFQQEEFGTRPSSWGRRAIAATSGGYNWRTA